MRTNVKSKEYFEKFFDLQSDDLNYYEKFIQDETNRVAKLSDWIQTGKVAESRIPAVKSTIFTHSLHTVIAKYSYGENPRELVDDFLTVITRFEQGWDDKGTTPEDDIHFDNYVLMLWMLSLGVLLDIPDDDFNRIVAVLDKSGRKDFLFDYLIRYRMSARAISQKPTYEVYRPLFEICNGSEKSDAAEKLKIFLEKSGTRG